MHVRAPSPARGACAGTLILRSSPFISRRAVSRRVSGSGAPANRVLIVDDSEMTARLMMQLLARAGFVCEHAANGKLAVGLWKHAILSGPRYDVTLMDRVGAGRGPMHARAHTYTHIHTHTQTQTHTRKRAHTPAHTRTHAQLRA